MRHRRSVLSALLLFAAPMFPPTPPSSACFLFILTPTVSQEISLKFQLVAFSSVCIRTWSHTRTHCSLKTLTKRSPLLLKSAAWQCCTEDTNDPHKRSLPNCLFRMTEIPFIASSVNIFSLINLYKLIQTSRLSS